MRIWEELRRMGAQEERPEEVKLEDGVEIIEEKKDEYPMNPYRYNIQGSLPKSSLELAPCEREKEAPTLDEIKEKIAELEKVSKVCVSTTGQGINAYWMMNKELENKVDCLYNRINAHVDVTIKLSAETDFLLKVVSEQQKRILGMTSHFQSIALACSMKKPDVEMKEDAPVEPEQN